jgi:hypothetical protein
VPVGKFKRKNMKKKIFFAFLKSLKNRVGSGSISQRYGSGDPDPHQNVTDPQHWNEQCCLLVIRSAGRNARLILYLELLALFGKHLLSKCKNKRRFI